MSSHGDAYDWAILVLGANVGNQVGWYGLTSYGSSSDLDGTSVTVLGYPIDTNYGFNSDGRYQYSTGENIESVTDNNFEYSAYVFEGFSGGPILRDSDNYIVGVHKGMLGNNHTRAYGVRITSSMIDLIKSLKGE